MNKKKLALGIASASLVCGGLLGIVFYGNKFGNTNSRNARRDLFTQADEKEQKTGSIAKLSNDENSQKDITIHYRGTGEQPHLYYKVKDTKKSTTFLVFQ